MTKDSYYSGNEPTQNVVVTHTPAHLSLKTPQALVSIGNNNLGEGQRTSDQLRSKLILGLQGSSPSLPSMLLWDDDGIRKFNELELHPNYYPSRVEFDLVSRYADEIAIMTPPSSILIELGCGSLRKTGLILSAFERLGRPVHYYALDVSGGELRRSLKLLRDRFAHSSVVSIGGLHGTYDDCVTWLGSSPSFMASGPARDTKVSFLWLGNSIANMEPNEATALLAGFHHACSKAQLECTFIIGSDACNDPATILRSYGPNYEAYCNFILSGLHCANRLLGSEALPPAAFLPDIQFDIHRRCLQVYYVAQRRVEVPLNERDKDALVIKEGQKVPIIHSYKWSSADMAQICEAAGLEAQPKWKAGHIDYYLYAVKPRPL